MQLYLNQTRRNMEDDLIFVKERQPNFFSSEQNMASIYFWMKDDLIFFQIEDRLKKYKYLGKKSTDILLSVVDFN